MTFPWMDDFSQSQFVFGSWCGSGEPCALWWCPRRWLDLRPPSFPGFFKTSPRFLVSSNLARFSGFMKILPVFLVSFYKTSPDNGCCHQTVFSRSFRLLVHHRSLRLRSLLSSHIGPCEQKGTAACRRDLFSFPFFVTIAYC